MAKYKNHSHDDWDEEWGTPDNYKEYKKRARRDQRMIKQQAKDLAWIEEERDKSNGD